MNQRMCIVALIICASIGYAAVCGVDLNSAFAGGSIPNPAELATDLAGINLMAIVSRFALGVSACFLIVAAIIAPGKSEISEVAASR